MLFARRFTVAKPGLWGLLRLSTSLRHCSTSRSTWTCGCGFSNFSFRGACFQCNAAKPESVIAHAAPGHHTAAPSMSLAAAGDSSSLAFRKGDWICACGAHNFARRQSCLVCSAQRKQSADWTGASASGATSPKAVPFRPGDWLCPRCSAHNFRSRHVCMQCDLPRPASTDHLQGSSRQTTAEWVCNECHTPNAFDVLLCQTCGTRRPPEPLAGATPDIAPRDAWACAVCGFSNFASRTACKRCHAVPHEAHPPTDTFWTCDCGYRNAASCGDCRECGAQMPT